MSDRLAELAKQAYAAALDDTIWKSLAESLSQELGGTGGALVVIDTTQKLILNFMMILDSAPMTEEYGSTWSIHDPQVAKVNSIKKAEIYTNTDLAVTNSPEQAAYKAWEERNWGGSHYLTAASPIGSEGMRAALSVHYAAGRTMNKHDAHQKLAAIWPQLSHAFELGYQHARMLVERYWEGISSRQPEEAALLLDEHGRMVRATEAAMTIIGRDDGIGLRIRRLYCHLPAEDAHAAAMIGRSIATENPIAGAMRVTRRLGQMPYVLAAYPLVRQRRMLAPYEAATLVTITDPAQRRNGNIDLLRQAFSLTSREAEFAMLLLKGHSVESASFALGIAMPTARSHVRALLAKTGTMGQSGLVQLIGSFR